ncbi:MAG: hypothetical protein BIFFINMI_04401 [Phycisphaerae bacterium]|nr:hypothetical protein [Phycisphaerae bacterium]
MMHAARWLAGAAAVVVLAVGSALAQEAGVPADLAVLMPHPVEKSMFHGNTTALPAPGEFVLPLDVTEQWGQGGPRFVSGGVPLLPGQAKEASDLTLAVKDKDGNLVPVSAQFRVLARWWRADNSIRWVLADFQASMGGSDTRTFYLTNRKLDAAAPAGPLAVEQNDDAITITTGPARFVVSRKKFNLLSHAYVDNDGNGRFEPGEDLLAASDTDGVVMEDTLGNKYYGSADTRDVRVIESGPQRVRVRARGVNKDPSGKGYSKGMYEYDFFMDFYAGSTDVRVDAVLGNNFAKSIGSPTFDDASVMLKLAGGGAGYRIYGGAPLDGKLAGDARVMIYQDSNGADTWREAQGHYAGETSTFRGYRALFRTPSGKWQTEHENHGGYGTWEVKEADKAPAEQVMIQGDQARGLTSLYNKQGGLIVHTQFFWEQFPKGVEVGADGTVRIALFPREYKAVHYFEDASAKGHVLVLHFYTPKMKKVYAADEAGRTWPHVFADCWDCPVFPEPTMAHKAATGAMTDLGPYTPPTRGFETWPLEVNYRRMLMTDKYWGNGFGWQVFGSRWQAHGGHSMRGARQPIKEDAWLYKFYTINDRNWRIYGEARSRNFRDVRCYRIEGQDPFGFDGWGDFSKANRSEDYTNRPQPSDAEYKKFTEGFWPRSTWWLPNPAHQTLDLIYDRYLLFGDQRALENMRIVAAHAGYWLTGRPPYVHRETGWSFRALERYWELTGDAAAEKKLDQALEVYKGLIGKTPLVCGTEAKGGSINWWFTQVFSRGVSMTALHTGDARALDLVKTLVVDKESRTDYFCMLFAVAYHLTGEQKYKDAILKKTHDGDTLLTVNTDGDFPATAHWLMNQPPAKK